MLGCTQVCRKSGSTLLCPFLVDGRGRGSPNEFTGMGSVEMTDPRLHLGVVYF